MRLSINTYVYECARVPIQETLRSAKRMGFTLVDLAGINGGDPTSMSASQRKEVIAMMHDLGLQLSQFQLAYTQQLASSDAALRAKGVDYMKRCAEFVQELGGREMLVWWGCGVLEFGIPREQSWMYAVNSMKAFCAWCEPDGLIVELELEPHNFSFLNNTAAMVKMVEDVNTSNIYSNVDIGHMSINRESPIAIEKFGRRILHAHISETDLFEHTNGIIGTGRVDYPAYINKLFEVGIEENCQKLGITCAAGIEMGEKIGDVDDPERWIRQSLGYLKRTLPELTL
ncbi:MAG: sugar phosphate isomerase/epimerase [Anaerolineae bacterium]|nr:sugar phosphate isomerase/epimerase [Anaerolineae bacterium]